jgi:peptide/nickel transport system permease protein
MTEPVVRPAGEAPAPASGRGRRLWRRLLRRPLVAAALAVLAVIVLAALLAPLLPLPSPDAIDTLARLAPPSRLHPFGTDNFGRDLLSRVIYAGRVSLPIGCLVMLISAGAGALIGLLAGYYPRADAILMRVMDGLMAFPPILLAMAFVAALGAGERNEIIAIALVSLPVTARVVRASTLQIKALTFVEAARAEGSRDGRILVRHVLVNALPPLIVQATFVFAQAILSDAALSYLGLGVKPPVPTWGNILDDAHVYVGVAPWFSLFPGLAIVLSVLCLNIVGDALRDVFDPKGRR